jgi:hypothetical protein
MKINIFQILDSKICTGRSKAQLIIHSFWPSFEKDEQKVEFDFSHIEVISQSFINELLVPFFKAKKELSISFSNIPTEKKDSFEQEIERLKKIFCSDQFVA